MMRMMHWHTGLFMLLLCGCPERRAPERGLQLVYKKATFGSVRSTVDRRLAQLKLKANLSEDDSRLTVRVSEGSDMGRIKKLFAQRGHLEFCAEDATVAARWCDEQWPGGITVDSAGSTCALVGPSQKALQAALGDAGVDDFAWGKSGTQTMGYSITQCFTPRIVSAEPHLEQANVGLEFDRASAKEFAALTTSTVGRRLIIRLDGVVESAPIVMQPITGGKAMLTTGTMDPLSLELLAATLVGGSLPELVLEKEGTWGPPSL